jgi:hypothetical protein
MDKQKQEFYDVIQQLIPLGEDKKELHYWEGIFDDLTEEEKVEVLANLKEELASIKSVMENDA